MASAGRRLHRKAFGTSLAALAAAGALLAFAAGYGADHPWWRVGPGVDGPPDLLWGHTHAVYYPTYYQEWYDLHYRYPDLYPYYESYASSYDDNQSEASTVIIVNNTVVLDASNGGVIQDVSVDQSPDAESGTGVEQQ
ncbi:MAG: hypothetical protein HY681_00220 [Chloroflexi bacterium]|nr:hypothetical protein [Chloroflexota bacterium]